MPKDRREHSRLDVRLPAAVHICKRAQRTIAQVTIENVCPTGMGFSLYLSSGWLASGSLVTLQLAAGTVPIDVPASVIWFHHRPDSTLYVGVRLQPALAGAAMRQRLVPWMATVVSRATPRRRTRLGTAR